MTPVAKIASVDLLTAGASLAAGAVLGFIFGVPKSQSASATGSIGPAGNDGQQYGANTNLEQISDWLAKTIVGVSLVELSKLPPMLDKLATYVAGGMGDPGPHFKAVALVIMIYFVSAGFLISYLWSRMELTRAFTGSILSKRMDEFKLQLQSGAKAIADVHRWLNNHPTAGPERDKAREEMMDEIKKSSAPPLAQVFVTTDDYQRSVVAEPIRVAIAAAETAKASTDEATKAAEEAAKDPAKAAKAADATKAARAAADAAHIKMKEKINAVSVLTLPIFQALVEADYDQLFHRNRSQYAFSLMTRTDPPKSDWQKALDVMQDAIKIRDRSKEPGWTEYEFARALCRIHLGQDASDIKNDLKKVEEAKLEQDKIYRLDPDDVVAKWRSRNP